MIESDRVLRPLREAEPAIERLETYESPAVLIEALRATWHAVERTLRLLLRSDAGAPDAVRLTAMSPDQLSVDAVVAALRRQDRISLELAGRLHELWQVLHRAERGEVRASDADVALDVVHGVTSEVQGAARRAAATAEPETPADGSPDDAFDEADVVGYAGPGPLPRRPLLVAGAALALVVVAVVAVTQLGMPSPLEEGIAAFREDRDADAEQHFRAALIRDEENNTARLYLARILRADGRTDEAAQLLNAALATDPDDAAVHRELGYLLLEQGRERDAATSFRRAVEADPEDALNWVGAIESLRRAEDPSAEDWLRRAPPAARDLLEQRRGAAPRTEDPT